MQFLRASQAVFLSVLKRLSSKFVTLFLQKAFPSIGFINQRMRVWTIWLMLELLFIWCSSFVFFLSFETTLSLFLSIYFPFIFFFLKKYQNLVWQPHCDKFWYMRVNVEPNWGSDLEIASEMEAEWQTVASWWFYKTATRPTMALGSWVLGNDVYILRWMHRATLKDRTTVL